MSVCVGCETREGTVCRACHEAAIKNERVNTLEDVQKNPSRANIQAMLDAAKK